MANQQDQGNSEKRLRGFAAMDENKRREIARLGGKAAHVKGTAHEFTSEEARAAGKKGGQFSHSGQNAAKAPSPPLEPVE